MKPSNEAWFPPRKGHYPVEMKGLWLIAATVGLVAVPAAGARGDATSRPSALATVAVVGSGPLAWSSVAVRAQPTRTASVLTTLKQFRQDFRPRVVLALEQRLDPTTGEPAWLRIALPGRPNGRSGWIPAASATLTPVDRWLVIYRGARTFEFYVNGKIARKGKVAIGKKGTETPTGLFYVQAKFDPTWKVLGAYAFETSGYSKLSDWPGGGVVGVHGTNTPELIGQAVSHGCVRLLNKDIQYLRSVVPVGTPIKIVAA